MYVLLSQVKGWDNSLIEEKMSTPLVSYILSGGDFTCCIDTGNFLAGISPPQTQGFKTLF